MAIYSAPAVIDQETLDATANAILRVLVDVLYLNLLQRRRQR